MKSTTISREFFKRDIWDGYLRLLGFPDHVNDISLSFSNGDESSFSSVNQIPNEAKRIVQKRFTRTLAFEKESCATYGMWSTLCKNLNQNSDLKIIVVDIISASYSEIL